MGTTVAFVLGILFGAALAYVAALIYAQEWPERPEDEGPAHDVVEDEDVPQGVPSYRQWLEEQHGRG